MSLFFLKCALRLILPTSDNKGSPVGDGGFHATTDVADSFNPKGILKLCMPSAEPSLNDSRIPPALFISDMVA